MSDVFAYHGHDIITVQDRRTIAAVSEASRDVVVRALVVRAFLREEVVISVRLFVAVVVEVARSIETEERDI